eukprot:CAMPEP_0114338136 /NCGR_PEP_ID=MMETSP0101-20121206/6839_1 /TAXON_ID=38822 ORGANISM="Pteridomonas danica, Strain PT" /NCGR_SAMPLE_ID=MMETSP0101 /ASSEMBLY_ACC=CAM_ASM_000211 /LENGTH=528 /DNA_ID=CAMNT_0001470625 /DNA_START=631 /DNA_END=2217 /DNA_ORIENTATION=-
MNQSSSSFSFSSSSSSASSSSSSSAHESSVDMLNESAVSLLDIGLKQNHFSSRKTMLSLSKLALLASCQDAENDDNEQQNERIKNKYPPLSPFHENNNKNNNVGGMKNNLFVNQNQNILKMKEEKEENLKIVELNLALLQLQLQLEKFLPKPQSQTQQNQMDDVMVPTYYEEPQQLLFKILSSLENEKIKKQNKMKNNKKLNFDHVDDHEDNLGGNTVQHAMFGLALLDILNSLNHEETSSLSSSITDTTQQGDGRGGAGGLYYCKMNEKTGDILLDLKINTESSSSSSFTCQGQGIGYRGFFEIDPLGSEWNTESDSTSSLVIKVKSPGGGVGFGSSNQSNNDGVDGGVDGGGGGGVECQSEFNMQCHHDQSKAIHEIVFAAGKFNKINKEYATLIRSKIELKILGIKFWSAIIKQDLSDLLLHLQPGRMGDISDMSPDNLNKLFQNTLLWKTIYEHENGIRKHEFRAPELRLSWYPQSTSSHLIGSEDFIKLEDLELFDMPVGDSLRIFSLLKQCISSARNELGVL